MAQTRTDAFLAAAEALTRATAPVVLVRLALVVAGTVYWTTRGGQYPAGGQYYTELLTRGITLSLGLDNLGRAQRGFGDLELANALDGAGWRPSDLFATETLANASVEIDYLFRGLVHPTDSLRLFTGAVDVPEEDCFDDTSMRLSVLDDGNPLYEGIQHLAAGRVHKTLGTRITAAAYPGADPDVIGKVKPLIYGAVTDSPAYPIDAGALDVLALDLTAVGATITLSDTAAFALFPATGTVQIESEKITYTGKGTLTLTGCTRGTGGTTAATHAAGKQCYEVQAGGYVYLVAGHAVKSITNVKVDGRCIDSGSYTTDLAAATITFTAKATKSLAVTVTSQPVFTPTTVSEQTPGSVTITAEQTPGGISTTAEQGVSTATGSHGHTGDLRTHQYPLSPPVPWTSKSDTMLFDFPAPGKAGTTAEWHINVTTTSGVWKIRNAGTLAELATLSAGENFFTEAADTTDEYQLYESSAGTITISMCEREITTTAATTNNAAAGVAASMTGATASSMAALADATAANMANLSGSTAISLAQTQNTVVSAADVVVGTSVTCDVEGYVDDGGGTYTGTPAALITDPSDQVRHILAVQLGLTLVTWVDTTSFDAARAAYTAGAIIAGWGLYDQIDSAELLERLRWSCAARLFQAATGKFKMHVLPLSGSSVKTFTEASDVLDEQAGGGPIQVGRTSLADLYNQVMMLGAKRINGDGYGTPITVSDEPSQTTYRMIRTLIIENDFVRDATALDAIADIYLAWHKDQKWRATIRAAGEPCVHLEPCDKISITSTRMPGGWTAKAFWIERLQFEVARPGLADLATLVCREV